MTRHRPKEVKRWIGLAFVTLLPIAAFWACSAYDPSLLDPLDERPASGAGGSGAGGAGGVGGGAGGSGGADGGAPTGEVCGDGVIGRDEKCDTSIAAGLPGACPTSDECAASSCPPQGIWGLRCQAECVDLPLTCGGLDSCCGRSCNARNDPDCSSECGNGVVDVAMGETCEPGTVNDCSPDCSDGDPCTTDVMHGSDTNCNVVCNNPPIVRLIDGDGCCPPDGHADNDDDC